MVALSLWKKRRRVWADGQRSRKLDSPHPHQAVPSGGTLPASLKQTPCAGQDGADSLCLLNVLNALGQAHVECLREQEGHRAAAHCYPTVGHLGQRLPHLVQQKHKWGQSPAKACHEGGVPHPILPGKEGHRGGADHHEKEMDTSFISDLGKKCRSSAPSPYFSLSSEAFLPPGFSSARLFLSCFFLSLYLPTMIIFPREQL